MSNVAKIEKQIKELKTKLEAAKKALKFECMGCHKKTSISKLELIVEQFYVPPRGCSDGDYWTEGENPDFYVKCPKCNKEIRYYYFDYGQYLKPSQTDIKRNESAKFISEHRWSFGKETERCRESRYR